MRKVTEKNSGPHAPKRAEYACHFDSGVGGLDALSGNGNAMQYGN